MIVAKNLEMHINLTDKHQYYVYFSVRELRGMSILHLTK